MKGKVGLRGWHLMASTLAGSISHHDRILGCLNDIM